MMAASPLPSNRSVHRLLSYEEYHPYGTTAWQAPSLTTVSLKRYKYTGMERDEETGLQRHGVRYYATWLGRWTSADPIGLGAGVNRFGYCLGGPAGALDSSGMVPQATPSRAPAEGVSVNDLLGGKSTKLSAKQTAALRDAGQLQATLAVEIKILALYNPDDLDASIEFVGGDVGVTKGTASTKTESVSLDRSLTRAPPDRTETEAARIAGAVGLKGWKRLDEPHGHPSEAGKGLLSVPSTIKETTDTDGRVVPEHVELADVGTLFTRQGGTVAAQVSITPMNDGTIRVSLAARPAIPRDTKSVTLPIDVVYPESAGLAKMVEDIGESVGAPTKLYQADITPTDTEARLSRVRAGTVYGGDLLTPDQAFSIAR